MPRNHDEYGEQPQDREDITSGLPTPEPGETPNFESRVNEVDADSDALFDEDLNPTDEPRQSDR